MAPQLAARYRVIVPDVRGRGLSARDPDFSNYQIPVYLQDVQALLAGLGVARVGVVGTSMGGLMAMVLAVTQPGLVARMVLNDVGPGDRPGRPRAPARLRRPHRAGAAAGRRRSRRCAASTAPRGRA